ncbi:DEAD/DEAH box helicase [Albimonas pacifica]|uniref:ATP-dependent RNA helicase DeaD n=1 Tax=Albimonas pacifica TaxID=1114924 RepID=A0A1I3KYB9_9RHOB|nr:ATP-dependent RNA helicase DeaD [Albimonas pacifica]
MLAAQLVPSPLLSALAQRGYEDLTPVQEAVLDPEVAGRDALVSARTGSGKTVAFGLSMAADLLQGAERLGPAEAPLALVVAPTRELAMQVRRELEWLYAPAGAVFASCIGGMDPRAERRALERGAHIVVGTPGRLRDHIERRALDLADLRTAVLDEADEMLDLGFREDLEFILAAAPEDRRTLLFSATVPKGIAALAERFQRDAARISTAAERRAHADIDYRAYAVIPADRENAVYNLLRFHDAERALVFCTTRASAAHLAARFTNRGLPVVALSGELSQSERSHALQAMRDGRARICVATDVAARGIDLPGLDLVIHADLPTNSETLVHRSGRTGRAGRKGLCALIVPVKARRKAERLLAGAGVETTWASPPGPAEIQARDDASILEDPGLAEAVAQDEQAMVAALLERHGPERVAAAFLRRLRAGMAAPEELTDPGEETRRPAREAFGASVWFELSVGRKQRAEPRWLLPMILSGGDLERRDVGAIRIGETSTHVQIAADRAEAFLDAISPGRTLEKGVRVAPSDGPPPGSERGDGPGGRPRRSGPPSRPHRKGRPAGPRG